MTIIYLFIAACLLMAAIAYSVFSMKKYPTLDIWWDARGLTTWLALGVALVFLLLVALAS